MDNPEKQAILGTQDTRRRHTAHTHIVNMCWTSLCGNKHKERSKDMVAPTSNWR